MQFNPTPRAQVELGAETEAMAIYRTNKHAPIVRAYVHGYVKSWDRCLKEIQFMLKKEVQLKAEAEAIVNAEIEAKKLVSRIKAFVRGKKGNQGQ